jgi:hypothetical protein
MLVIKARLAVPVLLSLALLGCSREGELTSAGVTIVRSACPAVAIPAATGDVTLFNPPSSRDAAAIDVVASMTNVRSTCAEQGEYLVTNTTFDVYAQRRDATGPRDVVLPYFTTVVQAGTNVVAKRVGQIALHFPAGEYRASASGSAAGQVLRSAATLPADIEREITRERRPGDINAALDPMADPKIRAAVARHSFEVLIGFQLTPEQLAYNATR